MSLSSIILKLKTHSHLTQTLLFTMAVSHLPIFICFRCKVFCYSVIFRDQFIMYFPFIEKKRRGETAECNTVKLTAINIHTNLLMPIGARECNFIQHNSIHLLLEVLSESNFGVHHSSTLNCICL